jgi:antitoxin HicB
MKTTGRDASYYLALNYPVELRALTPDEGGGFMACIPLLGRDTFVADGETPEDAFAALMELKGHLIPALVAEGVVLAEPLDAPSGSHSGNVLLRLPPSLHARLAASARQRGCSLNKHATEILAIGSDRIDLAQVEARLTARLQAIEARLPVLATPHAASRTGAWVPNTGGGWTAAQQPLAPENRSRPVDSSSSYSLTA